MEFTITFGIITAVLIGLVQVAKTIGLPTRWAALTAVVLGVVACLSLTLFRELATPVFYGVVAGLSAAGLWSGTKATIGK